ncbi:C39 family peptidase [Raoultibacter massiliensis]|uniref:C39 family peptidase n=1 Tax=Raoultibacter massiliensis TaxID=1852371 RepID=A0ABV1JC16_9ACTN
MQAIQGNLPVADAAYRSPAAATAQSTPMAQWEKGSVPLLYQTDPAWSNIRYAENHFGESGCGPTCMAMVYIALTGATDKDPAAMAELATKGGYAGPDGTAWLFMTEGAASLGLAATEVGADEQSIRRELVKGRPIIASMGPGDFTTTGHFIVITDIDKNSNLVIHDPNSPERSAKAWSFDTVIGQCRALWSYSLI